MNLKLVTRSVITLEMSEEGAERLLVSLTSLIEGRSISSLPGPAEELQQELRRALDGTR